MAAIWIVWLEGQRVKTSRENVVRQKGMKGVLITSGMGITKWRMKLRKMGQFCWQVGMKRGVCEFGKGEEGNNVSTE